MPHVVDHARVRCPAPSAEQRAVLASRVAPPAPGDLRIGAWQRKTEELLASEDAKGRVGLALADELDRCRDGDRPPDPPPEARAS